MFISGTVVADSFVSSWLLACIEALGQEREPTDFYPDSAAQLDTQSCISKRYRQDKSLVSERYGGLEQMT